MTHFPFTPFTTREFWRRAIVRCQNNQISSTSLCDVLKLSAPFKKEIKISTWPLTSKCHVESCLPLHLICTDEDVSPFSSTVDECFFTSKRKLLNRVELCWILQIAEEFLEKGRTLKWPRFSYKLFKRRRWSTQIFVFVGKTAVLMIFQWWPVFTSHSLKKESKHLTKLL